MQSHDSFVDGMAKVVVDSKYRALLLQGPVGPFFGRLQDAFDLAGWATVKIQFNAGDCLFHSKGRDVWFSEGLDQWASWLENFLPHFRPDVILLFGDQRPIHKIASIIAARFQIPVACLEEGYLRPDFITLEMGGNNALSPLRNWHPSPAADPVNLPVRSMASNGFFATASRATQYFATMSLGSLQFPYYQHHRQRGLPREMFMWLRNAWRKQRFRLHNRQTVTTVLDGLDKRYFIVALQVHDDLQLKNHGNGWTLEKLIEAVTASFSHCGLPDNHLVFKGHPLDRGHSSTRIIVLKLAALYGVRDRIHYVDDSSLGPLAQNSRGMVTINSTSAVVSFDYGRPVFALGAAFYEPMTTNRADRSLAALDRFWRLIPAFDNTRWKAFRAHMIARSLVNGSFYLEDEIEETCARVIVRLQKYLGLSDFGQVRKPILSQIIPNTVSEDATVFNVLEPK